MSAISPGFGPRISTDPRIPNGPHQIAVNQNTGDIFVTNQADGSLSILNPQGPASVVRLPVNPGATLHVRTSPTDNSAVVLVDTPAGPQEADTLFKITPTPYGQPQIDGPIKVENGDYSKGFEVDDKSGAIMLGNNRSGSLHHIAPSPSGRLNDPQTMDQAAPLDRGTMEVQFNPLSDGVFVLNHDLGQLRHVSAQDTSNPLSVGGGHRYQMAVNRGRGTVAVLNESENRLYKFSADGTQQTWNLPYGEHKLAAHDGNGAFIVTNRGAGRVMAFLDGAQAADPIVFNTGKQPVNVVVDPALSDAFVLNADGTMSVITGDGQTMEVASINRPLGPTIEAGGHQAMAVNPTNHEVYLANTNTATLTRMKSDGAEVVSLTGQN